MLIEYRFMIGITHATQFAFNYTFRELVDIPSEAQPTWHISNRDMSTGVKRNIALEEVGMFNFNYRIRPQVR